jgi:DNA-binding transcriptional regulator PaaX
MSKSKKRQQKVVKTILAVIGVAGIISVAVIAPNAVQMLTLFNENKKKRYNRTAYTKRVITRLADQGFIKFENYKGKKVARLTEKGKEKLVLFRLGELEIKRPKKWDEKWRVLIFDIREARRKTRDLLRRQLISLGFKQLQRSVWITPYECEDLVILLKADFKIGKDLLYMSVDYIENDKWLKDYFSVK